MAFVTVETATGIITNLITCDEDTVATEWRAPEGQELVNIPDGVVFNIGWIWDGSEAYDPNPQPKEDEKPQRQTMVF